jgi:UDP-N-acetylglucosamine acyltransferase
MIHPTAIIAPGAEVDSSCEIGPYAVIDAHVRLGAACRVGPHVHLTGHTTIGAKNRFHAGCVIGDAPQDAKYNEADPTRLRIGDHNVFREHVTVHRSNKLSDDTVIGDGNFLMAHCHVGHNSLLGNNIIVANGALIAGHVTIGDRAFISGNCLLHQFVRVGALALMQGGSGISKDLPPYTIARGGNHICGLNVIGLRRAGIGAADRLELKRLYHALFRSGASLRQALAAASGQFQSAPAQEMLEFIRGSKRSVCTDYSNRGSDAEQDEN